MIDTQKLNDIEDDFDEIRTFLTQRVGGDSNHPMMEQLRRCAESWSKLRNDHERYQILKSGSLMSDGRPYIMQAIYEDGSWTGESMVPWLPGDTDWDHTLDRYRPESRMDRIDD